MRRPPMALWVGLGLVAAVALVLLATTEVLTTTARLPIVLGFVLFVPGAALAHALAVEDVLSFCVVAIGVSVGLVLVLSQLTVMTIGLSAPLVLDGLVLFTMICVSVRMVRPYLRTERRRP